MSMRKTGMFMLILCTALLCCGSLFAATYYVDVANGNNANDGLTAATAWKTIGNGEATNALSSGDTVKVLEGTYGPTALTSKSNGVTYLSEEGALIYAAEPNTTDNGFNLSGVSGVTIKGFVFSGLHRGIYLENGCSNIRITGNRFEEVHNQGGGEGCAVWVWSGSDVTIDHNIFKTVGTGPSEGCIVTGNAHNNVKVYNNVFDDVWFCIRNWGCAGTVAFKNNIIANVKSHAYHNSFDAWSCTRANNCYYNVTSLTDSNGFTDGGGELYNTDPLFVDTLYHIATYSPVIDKGVDVGYTYLGDAPDLGIYETEYAAPSGTVTGSVSIMVGDVAKPVAGATVTVGTETATTGADGTYTLSLDAGTYTASVADTGRFICTSGDVEVTVSATEGATANFTGTYEPTTFYVATNGSYDNPGTEDAPWAFITDGDKKGVVYPGDTVIVKAGEYHTTGAFNERDVRLIDCDGTADAPITYKAEEGAKIINDFVNSGNPRNNLTVCIHVSANYLVIDGFDLSGAVAPLATNHKAAGLVVKNCKMHDTDYVNHIFPQAAGAYLETNNSDATIENCEIYNIGLSATGMCGGIYTMSGFSSTAPQATYHHNYIHNVGGDGRGIFIRGGGTNDLVYNNTITNCNHGVYTMGGAQSHGSATAINNIIANCGYAFSAESDTGSIANSYNLVYATGNGNVALGANTLTTDPFFTTAPEVANYSPAVDSGTDLGYEYLGTAPDRGCAETAYVEPTGAVMGTVTANVNGVDRPMAGITVTVGEETTTTDNNGHYSVTVPAGSYTVSVTATDRFDCVSGDVDVTVTATAGATANFSGNLIPTTFYVATTGNDNNPGTADAPWATIDNGEKKNLLIPGDTVIVEAGEYRPADYHGFTFTTAGTAEDPIVYIAEDGVLVNDEDFVYGAFPSGVNQVPAAMAIRASNRVFQNFEVANFNVAFLITGGTGMSGIVIDGCDIHDAHGFTSGLDPACCGIYIDPSKNSAEVKNCRIHDFPNWAAFMDMTSHQTGEVSDHGTFKFHHNYVYNITGYGSWIRGYVDDQIYNNTFYNVTGNVIVATALTGNANPVVKNNIFANCGPALDGHDAGCTIVNSNNLFYNTTPTTGCAVLGENNVTGDPLFIDAANGDFRISDQSPAVNAGVDVGFDFEGPRPDIGAYETDVQVSGTISGVVTATCGDATFPVAGVTVTAGENTTTTASDGSYSMVVIVGDYTVTASDKAGFTCTSGSVNVTVPEDGSATADFSGVHEAATYYVATDGDYDNPGTEDEPWATIFDGDLKGALMPGDTVIVKEGTYTVSGEMNQRLVRLIDCGGVAGAPITYQAQGDVKIVNNDSQPANGNFTCAIHVSAPYIVLDGFDFAGGSAVIGVNHTTQGLVIKNCKIHDSTFKNNIMPMAAGIYMESGNSYTVENCEIYNIGLNCNQGIDSAGIYNMGGYGATTPGGAQGVYHHNYIHNIGNGTSPGNGFWIRGGQTNDLVYNNTVTDCTGSAVRTITGANLHGSATAINNIFANCATSLSAEADAGSVANSYNLIYGCGNGNVALGEGTVQADPLFTTAPAISSASPAVDAGIDLGYDFIGAAPDMGCYETAIPYEDVDSVDELLAADDGDYVSATFDLVVTSNSGEFGDFVYAQTANRLQAVRLDASALDGLQVGDVVTVKGQVASDADGKYVALTNDTAVTAGEAPVAIGLTNSELTNDVLVRVWGKVTSVDGNSFVVFNGYLDFTCVAAEGARVPQVGEFVSVTGIASDDAVLARRANDVRVEKGLN